MNSVNACPIGMVFQKVLVTLLVGALSTAVTAVAQNNWEWKQNRDLLAGVVEGRIQTSIQAMEKIHLDYPDNMETIFGLAIAYARNGEDERAVAMARRSIELGLPPERWLAGPRSLTGPVLALDADFADEVRQLSSRLLHGPHLGDVQPDSIRVWGRLAPGVRQARIEASTDPQFGWVNAVSNSHHSNPDVADAPTTFKLHLQGLTPGTTYFYRLAADSHHITSPEFHFRTADTLSTSRPVRIVFGGGAAYEPQYERMWKTIDLKKPDMLFLLGDNVYIDQPLLPDIQKYCYFRRHSSKPYRDLLAHTPVYAIWDDHDFSTNDSWGGPLVGQPAWKSHVLQVFKDNWINPAYGISPDNPGCFFSFSHRDIDFFFLDGRYYRTDPKVDNPSMLGPDQLAWLKSALLQSKATFKVLASPVPFAPGVKPGSLDPWDGFPKERNSILDFILQNQIAGVLLISADRHRSDIWKFPRPGSRNSFEFHEFSSSRLTNIHTHSIMKNSLFGYNSKCSFGLMEFNLNDSQPSITYSIHSIDSEEVYKRRVTLSELIPE